MALLDELKKLISNVENSKGEEMNKDKEVDNADVDKREILREADAIAMKPASDFKGGAEEKFRTLTKKLEQLSYNKSSRGTADNAENDDEKDEKKDDDKKSADKEKDVDNKKKSCDNGVDNSKTDYYSRMNEIYNASTTPPKQDEYITREERLEAGNRY